MGGGLHGGFGQTKGKAAAGDASFMRNNDQFLRNIRHRSDIDPAGKFDIIAHGTNSTIEIEHGNKKLKINSRTAAKLIKRLPGYREGQAIRLLSCSTGARSDGFAQDLANKLNVTVYAPSDILWSYPNGTHLVAARSKRNPDMPDLRARGKFIKYTPGGNKR